MGEFAAAVETLTKIDAKDVVAAVALLAGSAASQDAAPFPAGESTQRLEGLECTVEMPASFDAAKEHSLLLFLPEVSDKGSGAAARLAHLCKDDFVIVAPKASGPRWDELTLGAVGRIVADLKTRPHVGERRLHAAGVGYGGWALGPVAFDEGLRFQSATWIGSGWKGADKGEKLPKHAAKEMGVLAMVGGDDRYRVDAQTTVVELKNRVRTVEYREQSGLDHAWPDKLVPYFSWWLTVQEGRYTPGVCAAFDWKDSAALATAAGSAAKSGSFVYWYAAGDASNEKAKAFQNDALRDALVQRF